MDLTLRLGVLLASLPLVGCGEHPGHDDDEPATARLLISDIDLVATPGCISWLESGVLECPDPYDRMQAPPEGTRAYELHGGYIATCGLEGSRSDQGVPTVITCWQDLPADEPISYGAEELNPPAGANFTVLAASSELDLCAAGPGVTPVCWGGDPETTPQPREEIATRTDVVDMTTSPCDLCILTADGIVTCNAAEPVRGIKDCTYPFGEQTFTAIDGNEYGICGITTSGGLQCADYRQGAWRYAWNSAIPANVQWASFEVAWEGGCGLTTEGEAVCFGTRDLYAECLYDGCDDWFGDYVDITAWYRNARFEGAYSKIVPAIGYVYALRATGEVELHWDPGCANYDLISPCPPDPSLWDALGYTEPVHPQQVPGWVQFP